MLIKMPLYLRKSTQRVKAHTRAGKQVHAYSRAAEEKIPKRKAMSLRANYEQMEAISKTIEANMGYLVYMGKEIANTHGLDVRFSDSQPIGDLADLVAEGKHGMIIGGMESIRSKKTGDLRIMQMKTRAKQQMRALAKQFMGEVRLPRDVVKHLAIIGSAKEKFGKLNDGEKPTVEALAEMIILYKRTREGGKIELDQDQKIARIEALEGYRGALLIEDFSIQPYVDEEDVSFWTKWTREERDLRRETHAVLKKMVEEGSLPKDQQDILFLRFYVDKPELSRGQGTRSFEAIAKELDQRRGIKKMKVRLKAGDRYRFTPKKKVKVVSYVMRTRKIPIPGKPKRYKKKVITYKWQRYKNPVSAEVLSVGAKSFKVRQSGHERTHTIPGKPPFKDVRTNTMDIFRKYQKGVEAILSHPSASDELKAALAKMQKSMIIVIPLGKQMQISYR